MQLILLDLSAAVEGSTTGAKIFEGRRNVLNTFNKKFN